MPASVHHGEGRGLLPVLVAEQEVVGPGGQAAGRHGEQRRTWRALAEHELAHGIEDRKLHGLQNGHIHRELVIGGVREDTAEQIRRLFSVLRFLKPEVGAVLAREGERRPELFVVVSAQLEATRAGRSVRSFGPRDILGETALFERAAWPATLTVTAPGLVLALDLEGVEKALIGNPDPRGLLGPLRDQGRDRELAVIAARLGARGTGAGTS